MNDNYSSKKDEDIARRFIEAEKLIRKHDYYQPPKKDWNITYCPKCQRKIEYLKKKAGSIKLTCPDCGKVFTVSSLEDLFGNKS